MTKQIVGEMGQGCLLTRSRLIARAVTSIYDDALRPFGIQSSQFALLVVVANFGPEKRAAIGRIHRQDRSTLTRNLKIMLREGWIMERPDDRNKGRLVAVTEDGLEIIEKAAEAWRSAQNEARALVGTSAAGMVIEVGNRLFDDAAA